MKEKCINGLKNANRILASYPRYLNSIPNKTTTNFNMRNTKCIQKSNYELYKSHAISWTDLDGQTWLVGRIIKLINRNTIYESMNMYWNLDCS